MDILSWQTFAAAVPAVTATVAAIKAASSAYRSHIRRVAEGLERDRTARLAEEAVVAKNEEIKAIRKERDAWREKYESERIRSVSLSTELAILRRTTQGDV